MTLYGAAMRGYRVNRSTLIVLLMFLLLGVGFALFVWYEHDHVNCENGSERIPITGCGQIPHPHHR
jgi:hypothetical protein